MKIQVLGATGMLGREVCRAVLERGHNLIAHRVDITTLTHTEGDVVVNCAGLVKQLHSADADFVLVNGYAPHRIAKVCARLIHVSTDCVFYQAGVHSEQTIPQPKGIYAVSKLAGEVGEPHLTVRTSFIGHGAHGLVHDLMTQTEVKASDRLLWSGHTARTVARVLVGLAERDVCGLIHIPGEFQSRWTLVNRLATKLDTTARIIRDDAFVADRRLVSMRWSDLGYELPAFEEELEDLCAM